MTTSPDTDLRGRAGRALGWSLLSTIGARLGTLAIGIALARIVGPAEFGEFAIALVALLAMLSVNEIGVSLAIVRWPDDPRAIVPTVATLATASSLLVFGLVQLAAPAFARAMGDPDAAAVVRVLAISVVTNGLVSTSAAVLQREFMQGRKAIADQADNWLGALVSLGLAVAGFGAMSLAIGRVAGSLAGGALLITFSPVKPRFGWNPEIARRLFRFGLPLAGASLIVFAVGYTDQIVVGTVLGPTALGFYVLAVNLSNWPVAVFSQPVRAVAPAAFARLQHDRPTINRAFVATAGLLVGLTLPVCLLLSGAAPDLIPFVYGPEWAAAAVPLAGLAALAGFRIFFELVYDYLVVLERSRAVLAVQALWLVTLIPAMLLGVHYFGLRGAATTVVLVAALIVLPAYLWQLHRCGVDLPKLTRTLAPGVASALAVLGIAIAAVTWIDPGLAALAVVGTAGVGAAALYGYRNRAVLRDIKEAS